MREPVKYGCSANFDGTFKGILDTLNVLQFLEGDAIQRYKDVMAQLGVLLENLFNFTAQLSNGSGASVVTFVFTLFGQHKVDREIQRVIRIERVTLKALIQTEFCKVAAMIDEVIQSGFLVVDLLELVKHCAIVPAHVLTDFAILVVDFSGNEHSCLRVGILELVCTPNLRNFCTRSGLCR